VKLLLDENLSPRLVSRLGELYGSITHVRDIGLKRADDRMIWGWAREHEYSVITADADFVMLSQQQGFHPK
jgi:predicted nuclease of predicted toxin-antitoxin system